LYIRASYVASHVQVVKRLIQLEFESPGKTRHCEFVSSHTGDVWWICAGKHMHDQYVGTRLAFL